MSTEFSLFDHIDQRDEPLFKTYSERIEYIQVAEAGGMRGYHLAEHHGTPLGIAPSPSVFLAAAAQATSTIRLGPMVYLLPLYNPYRLLEEICMLDNLSNGRLDVGTGRGVSPIEVGFYGVDLENSGAMYGEGLDLLIRALHSDVLDHHGEYYNFDNIPLVLKPIQDPVPFWSAAAAPDALMYAAQRGMNLISLGGNEHVRQNTQNYKQAWTEHADHPLRKRTGDTQPYIGAYRLIVIAKTDKAADKMARVAYKNWFDKLALLWKQNNIEPPFLSALEDYDVARESGMLVVGSEGHVTDNLAHQIDTCDINYMSLQFVFGNLAHAEEMRSLDRFLSKVMPALSE